MTVNTTNVRDTTTGNGATTSFPFTFRALHPTHIEVYKAGVLQTYITNYTVTFTNSDGETGGTGGSIIFGAAPANGNALSFDRVTPRDQDYDPQYLAGLNEKELENAFDKSILIIQELEDAISGLGGGGGGGGGSVTSFSATPTSIFDVANATTTPALSLDNQSANRVLAGPSSGGATTPAFRALVHADLAASGANGEFLSIAGGALDWAVPAVAAGDLQPLFVTSESGLGITFTRVAKAANLVYAGPASGGSADPDFRSLVPADLASGGANGEVLSITAGALDWIAAGSVGTVTSFSATPSGIFDVANATTTPALSLDNQNANIVLAGPSSGGAATPAFRSLVHADLAGSGANGEFLGIVGGVLDWTTPPVSAGDLTPLFTTSESGLGITFAQITKAANLVFAGPVSGAAANPDFRALVPADLAASGANGEFLGIVGGVLDWATPAGAGTVTDFSAAPTGIFNVATSTTTPALSLDNQNANIVLAGPASGAAATPAFRSLVPDDFAASGADGQVLGITAGALDWVDAAGGGTVTSFSATPSGIFDVANATSTPALSLDNQNANIVLAGPASGGAATPAFRSLVHADLAASGANGEFLGIVGGALDWAVPSVSAGDLSPLFTTSESGLGITFAAVNQNANLFYGGPVSGSAAAPTFRQPTHRDVKREWETKTSAFTAVWGMGYRIDTSGGAFAITVPAATGSGLDMLFDHKAGTNTATYNRSGSTVFGGASDTSMTNNVVGNGLWLLDADTNYIMVG